MVIRGANEAGTNFTHTLHTQHQRLYYWVQSPEIMDQEKKIRRRRWKESQWRRRPRRDPHVVLKTYAPLRDPEEDSAVASRDWLAKPLGWCPREFKFNRRRQGGSLDARWSWTSEVDEFISQCPWRWLSVSSFPWCTRKPRSEKVMLKGRDPGSGCRRTMSCSSEIQPRLAME